MLRWARIRSGEFYRQIIALLLGWGTAMKAVESLDSAPAYLRLVAAVTFSLLTLGGLWYAWRDEKKRTPRALKSPQELVSDNHLWLAEQGRVVIVTRDLTWTMDGKLRELVHAKAEQDALTIVASRRTAELEEFAKAGVDVRIHKRVPSVRFAVLRYGTADSRVLVTRQVRGLIEVREYEYSDFPVHQACMDLVDEYLK